MNWKRNLPLVLAGLAACGAASAGQTNATSRAEYAYFRVIPERNLFNPNRYPLRRGAVRIDTGGRPAPADAFTLVGTMSYAKGTFAFFAGAAAEYQQVLERGGEIAGFRVVAIQPNAVLLITSNSTLEVRVGAQLQRDAETGWVLVPDAGAPAAVPAEAPAVPPPADGGAPSDVLKRLMQQREQELQ